MRARAVALHALKAAAAAADVVRRPDPGVVVLIYHRVGTGAGVELDVDAATFERQVEYLVDNHDVVTLGEALRLVAGATTVGRRPVVLTFDDGTRDFAETVVPVLARHRAPATVYVATEFVETGRAFPHGGAPVSWAALRDALATGLITVGSHTHTHALLDRLPASAIEDELDRSTGLIGDRLDVAARHLAYPKGLAVRDDHVDLVRRRFSSAAVGGSRPNRYGRTDPYALARSPVQASDGTRWFARKAGGGMALEERVRAVANRRRYRRAVA